MKNASFHLIEGMSGVGKTTFARRLYKQICQSGNCGELYLEETSQPVDLFRQAILSKEQYDAIQERYPGYESELKKNAIFADEQVIVAYTMLPYHPLVRELRSFDIGDGSVTFECYKKLHLEHWKRFAGMVNENGNISDYISDGALLHNQLFDIVGFYSFSMNELTDYFGELIGIIRGLNIRIYYLYVSDIAKLVENTLRERGCTAGTWGAGFQSWLEKTPYGQMNRLSGKDGMIKAYCHIDDLARTVLRGINVPVEYVDRTDLRCYDG